MPPFIAWILFSAFVFALFRFFTANKAPLFEAYQNHNRWYFLKYAFLFVTISRRKRSKPKSGSGQRSSGYGVKSKAKVEDMERPQQLPSPQEFPNAVDAVYFNSADRYGNYVIVAVSRRQHNIVQCLGHIRLEKLGLMELMEMPDTNFTTTFKDSFQMEGLHIRPVEPMKKWAISFDRLMKLTRHDGTVEENVRVRTELSWKALHKPFDFDVDQDIHVLCDALAREPWTRTMFQRLQSTHQTHYEQFGQMSGKVIVEGHGEYDITVQGVRDHSYGNSRDWSVFHRYGLQYAVAEDNTALAIGSIAMPGLMTNLTLGFVNYPDGRLEAIRHSDFELWENGELDHNPRRLRINCITGSGERFSLAGEVVASPSFFMGTKWSAKVYERLCQFELNGKRAWGISEWQYRNHDVKREIKKSEENDFDEQNFGN